MYDCIVIGGGPAGLAAATYLGRFMRSSLVIDAGGGRASSIPTTHNLLGFPEGISGQVLLARMHQHATRYGAKVVNDFVKGVVQTQSGFVVTTAIDEVRTRTLLLAQGVKNHRPKLSQEAHDRGVARGLIRYCPICDAYEIRGRRVAVLGCSEHGAAEAMFVRHYSDAVTLLTQDASRLSEAEKTKLTRGGIATERVPIGNLSINDQDLTVKLADGCRATIRVRRRDDQDENPVCRDRRRA